MIKEFVKKYPLIVLSFIISGLVVILYAIFEEYTHDCTVAGILFQLAIGIIVNSMFFFTQIYLVQKEQCKYANKCIVQRIESLQHEMREIFDKLSDRYFDSQEKEIPMDEVMLMKLLQRTFSGDYVQLINPRKYGRTSRAEFTVSEYIISKVTTIEREVDRLCSYYNQYVSPELMEVIELILKSDMHNNLARSLLLSPNGVRFDGCNTDIFYKPYFELIGRLEEVKKQYK